MHTHMDFTGKGFIGAAEAKTSNGTRMGTVWLAKGRYVEVVGQLRDNRWTDNDNREHFEVQLVAEAVRFLDRKPGQE